MKPAVAAIEMSGAASVAVWDGARVHERSFGDRRGRALLAELDALLEEAGVERNALSHVVAGTGPGSYTGLRIACAAARVLGFTLDVPALGLPSVAAAAWPAPAGSEVHVLFDAFRGEVYHAAYQRTDEGLRETVAPRVLSAADALEAVPADALLVGDPALCARAPRILNEDFAPRASDLLALALATHDRPASEAPRPGEAVPLYLRPAAFPPRDDAREAGGAARP